jgi:hypothetical protein
VRKTIAKKRKGTSPRNETLNQFLWEWFNRLRSTGIPISGPLIQEKARSVATELGIEGFVASNGWLESFRTRYAISFKRINGESRAVDNNVVLEWNQRLPTILEGFDLKDIFNCDETGLFFKALPDTTLAAKGDLCKGGKFSKERLTVLLCSSAVGEKLKPLVIGKALKPRAFKHIRVESLPVTWKSNKKAWMTSGLFLEWLQSLNAMLEQQGRRIALIMDNAPCHCFPELTCIKFIKLPANTTSITQPLDHGIIRNFKVNYRKKLLEKLIYYLDSAGSLDEIVRKITLLDAMSWIASAWNSVSADCIRKCFADCGIEVQFAADALNNDAEGDIEALGIALNLRRALEFVEADNSVSVANDPSTEQEWEEVMLRQLLANEQEDDVESERTENEAISGQIPTEPEAHDHLDKLISYVDHSEMSDLYLRLRGFRDAFVSECARKRIRGLRQTRITDLFKESDSRQ